MTDLIQCKDTVPVAKGCECTNDVHQTPTPSGYMQAHAAAEDRLSDGWLNLPCPDCGHFGWLQRQAFTTAELKTHDDEVAAAAWKRGVSDADNAWGAAARASLSGRDELTNPYDAGGSDG